VIVRPDDSVCLIDFELAHDVTDTKWRPGLNASGFARADRGLHRGRDISLS
jgi:hypothetical protein